MAKFCGNCGNPVEQGAVFCDNCGAKLDSFSGNTPIQQQYPQQSIQQPVQQMHYNYNNENTYSQTSASPQNQNKKKPLPFIIGGIAVLLVVVIVVIAVVGKSGSKQEEIDPVESFEEVIVDASTTEAQTTTEPITVEDNRPDFEKYGMAINIEKNKTFDVVAKIKGTDKIITGKGKLKSFTRETASKTVVEFMKTNDADVNGYELLKVSFVVEFPKSIMNSDTMTLNGDFTRIVTDYYDIDLYSDTAKTLKDTEGETYYSREINAGGKKKKIYFWLDSSASLENDTLYYHDDRTFLVPKGYDGVVCGYRDVHLTEQRIYKDYDKDKYDLFRLIGGTAEKKNTTKKATKKSTTKNSKKETLPYSNLGKPRADDFAWIADAQSGSLSGRLLSKNEFIGKWKAEIILDGVFKLANITIAKDGTVTVVPYKLNTGNGWKNDTDGKQTLKGEFDYGGAGNIFAIGNYGNLDLYRFMESNGTQYGLGTLSLPSGENVDVYLVRK